jgi:hypothetical protein
MANADHARMQSHLEALDKREIECKAEWKDATERSETVRARALSSELQRISRRRGELLLAMPRYQTAESVPRHNRGD